MALRTITPRLKLGTHTHITRTNIHGVAKKRSARHPKSRQHRLCRALQPAITTTIIIIIVISGDDDEETYSEAPEYKPAPDAAR